MSIWLLFLYYLNNAVNRRGFNMMMEWVLIMDLSHAAERVEMQSREACKKALVEINKEGAVVTNAICINSKTGEVIR